MAEGDQARDDNLGEASSSTPSITLPKGGGAIRGIGEKFAANPVTGTGSMSVPIATSPGRSGFGPQLSLSYDSGAGVGPFGFGWSLSLPAITRKTDKGLPKYRDAEDSDEFVLSGAEDLVPAFLKDTGGNWVGDGSGGFAIDESPRDGHTVRRYRPRIEGLFACIERWTHLETGDVHWRSITRDNITTLYGLDEGSRIVDTEHPEHIFSWLICQSWDDKGNVIVYKYKREDSDGVDRTQVHEHNRTEATRSANRYLKRILYGNRVSRLIDPTLAQPDWMFEVVFDYGEHDPDNPLPNEPGHWLCRHDPFSSYRPGFELRTYRLCQRVLMFHHFRGEQDVGPDCLVHSTDFLYRNIRDNPEDLSKGHPVASFIASITQSGYRRRDGGYLKKSLPPLVFEYSRAEVDETVHELDAESLENLPQGLDGGAYRWVDLDGEGISGVLTEQAGGWFYKGNLGQGRFGPLVRVASKPQPTALQSGQQQLLDLAGDGQLDLVAFDAPMPGFFERTHDERWAQFKAFKTLPNVDWQDPNLRFVDLTGDGHADILITEHEAIAWYPSEAESGFGPAQLTRKPWDEERGPRLIFADGTQSVYLSDMSGDGLTDLVRIRNGEVCYWPNLGYGRFGAKVTMDDAPWLDTAGQFDQRRVRLADIDGSGNTDIIYLGRDGVALYFNQSGNRWSEPYRLSSFPEIDNLTAVTALDLLGNGTACLVWSSPLPGDRRRPMRYIDLMGGQKPHLLIRSDHNLGAETHVNYAPSTRFYLQDKRDGRPWITKIPFPVHVVERVETYDHISRNRFVTRYAYHHGYFDGIEREFRGFGLVEQKDTEKLAALGAPPDTTNLDAASHVPPVLTKTWFHTGAHLEGRHISRQFEAEYYREGDASLGEAGLGDEQLRAMLLDDTLLPPGLSADETREACRALKGSILRQEVYGLDGTKEADRPYSVSERNYSLQELQRRGQNQHAVFFSHPLETIDFHYERKLFPVLAGQILDEATAAASPDVQRRADPRVAHTMNLEVDEYGNFRRSVAIGYGRRYGDSDPLLTDQDRSKQNRTLITYTENDYTNAVLDAAAYRTPLLCETRTYELRNLMPASSLPEVTNLFRFKEMRTRIAEAADGDHDLLYEDVDAAGAVEAHPYRRLIERVRTRYRPDDLGLLDPETLEPVNNPLALLSLGTLQSMALPGETYRLAFTPGLLTQVFQRPLDQVLPPGAPPPENLLPDPTVALPRDPDTGEVAYRGGYVDQDGDGHWWLPSGRAFYSPGTGDDASDELAHAQQHFFLPHRFRDPFNASATLAYDANALLLTSTTDPVENTVTAVNDYRVLQPYLLTDPNGNRSEVAFDALGLVAGTAVMGKTSEGLGDSLAEFDPDPTTEQIDAFCNAADPHDPAPELLGSASTRIVYDLDRFRRAREDHPDDPTRWPPTFAATLARETHTSAPLPADGLRIQIAFSYSDGFGREIQKKIQAEPGPVPELGDNIDPRWVGSGWTVFNNKGKPVRQYEPYFSRLPSRRHDFEFGVQAGVSPILCYDPLGRVVATLHPNHTWEKVVFDPWRQATWDVNDTVLRNPRADADVGDFFRRLPEDACQPAWHGLRTDPAMRLARWPDLDPDTGASLPNNAAIRANEERAAEATAVHADTPSIAFFDTLGRPFLTLAHNRFPHDGAPVDEHYPTRIELDIEGNQRSVIDAKLDPDTGHGRVVMRYHYDLLGNRIHQASMEAGERWMLNDVAGNPVRAWDSRGHDFRTLYDPLRRPLEARVRGADPDDPDREILYQRTLYGEGQDDHIALNLRTRIFRIYDGAGVVTNRAHDPATDRDEAYDFKGNLLRSVRQLVPDYRTVPDWSSIPDPDSEPFVTGNTYDALNRPTAITTPDSSIVRPTYNAANLLEAIEANLQGSATVTRFVDNIDYNAKGQRERIDYGIGAHTQYSYDPETFRLTHLLTTRGAAFPEDCPEPPPRNWPGCAVQNLRYTYDPAGNITHIRDRAQQTVFFRNQRVEPSNAYTYDAIYRLIQAEGREHIGQADRPWSTWNDAGRVGLEHPHNGEAMRRYTERYEYDEVGNFSRLVHEAGLGTWRREYECQEPSLIEVGRHSNRLSRTSVDGVTEPYTHDIHGNMTSMAHLPQMDWDFKDQLQRVDLEGGGTAYYLYDFAGQRVRKVIERLNGSVQEGRIYLGGFEVYRQYSGAEYDPTLERQTLHVMDDTQRIAMVENRTAGHDEAPRQLVRYQLGNHKGSASLELNALGQVISYEEYHPYGTSSYQAVRSQTETPKRYRYTGMERDEETGLNYHAARYYALWLGRWASVDPAGDKDGFNLYRYVRNNPVLYKDDTGLQIVLDIPQQSSSTLQHQGTYYREITPRRVNRFAQMLQDDLRVLFGIETQYDPETGEITLGDLTEDDIVNQQDVNALLRIIRNIESRMPQSPNPEETRTATEALEYLAESLVPADLEFRDQSGNPYGQRQEILLRRRDPSGQHIEGAQIGHWFRHGHPPDISQWGLRMDPLDFSRRRPYRRFHRQEGPGGTPDANRTSNPEAYRTAGPLFVLLHELAHPIQLRAQAGGNNYEEHYSLIPAIDLIRAAVNVPLRQYSDTPEITSNRRARTPFEGGYIVVPNPSRR